MGRTDTWLLSNWKESDKLREECYNRLCHAIKSGKSELRGIKLVRNGAPVNYGIPGTECDTPLHLALRRGWTKLADVLIDVGAKLDVKNSLGKMPMHLAAEFCTDADLMDKLISAGACINVVSKSDSQTPLHSAINAYNNEIAKKLVEVHAYTLYDNNHGDLFHFAATAGNKDFVEYLLNGQYDIDQRDKYGKTALHCVSGSLQWLKQERKDKLADTAAFLLAKGADVNAMDDGGVTPLYYAIISPAEEMVHVLIQYKPDIKNLGNLKALRMTLAPSSIYRSKRQILQDYGFRFSQYDIKDKECVEKIVRYNLIDLLEEFLSRGLDPNFTLNNQYQYPESMLKRALMYQNREMMEALLTKGADVNQRDAYGRTALFDSLLWDDKKSAAVLIKYGIDVNASRPDGTTALHYLAQFGYAQFIDLLVKHGANVDHKNILGKTPLHYAAQWGRCSAIKKLLSHGADINMKMEHDITPLHLAILNDHTKSLLTLLSYGANPDIRDTFGRTPLHIAVYFNMSEMKKLLISYSGGIYIKDESGITQYAGANSKTFHINYLKAFKQYEEIDDKQQVYMTASESWDHPPHQFFGPHFALRHEVNRRDIGGYKLLIHVRQDYLFERDDESNDTGDKIILGMNFEKYVKFLENRLFVLNLPIDTLDKFISGDSTNQQKILAKELLRMRIDEMYKGITMYDLLTKHFEKVVTYFFKKTIAKKLIFHEYQKKYPYYANLIQKKITSTEIYINKRRGEQALARIMGNILTDVPIREIVNYLSKADIEKLCINY